MALIDADDIAAYLALKGDPDQPRDEHGRWTAGGGAPAEGSSRIGRIIRGDVYRDMLRTSMLGGLRSAGDDSETFGEIGDADRGQVKNDIVAARGGDLAALAAQPGAVRDEMLRQYPDTEEGRATLEGAFLDNYQGPPSGSYVDTMTSEQLYGELKAQQYIDTWASTAGDSAAASQALQAATATELGAPSSSWEQYVADNSLRGVYRTEEGDKILGLSDAVGVLTEREGATMRAFVRSEYDATQSYLRNAGIGPNDAVTLYRGVHYGPNDGPSPFTEDGEYRAELNPASSWSLSRETASEFAVTPDDAASSNTFVLTTHVSASGVISTARTGRGALSEAEVLIGNPPGGLTVYAERELS